MINYKFYQYKSNKYKNKEIKLRLHYKNVNKNYKINKFNINDQSNYGNFKRIKLLN